MYLFIYFLGNSAAFLLGIYWIQSSKEKHLFKTGIFRNIILSLLPLLINLMPPCWIKVFLSLNQNQTLKHLNGSNTTILTVHKCMVCH